jgi:hypothetical protein
MVLSRNAELKRRIHVVRKAQGLLGLVQEACDAEAVM